MKIEFLHKLTTNSQSKVKGLAKFWLLLIFLFGSAVPALAGAGIANSYVKINDSYYKVKDGGWTTNCEPSSAGNLNGKNFGTVETLTLQELYITGWRDGGDWIGGLVEYEVVGTTVKGSADAANYNNPSWGSNNQFSYCGEGNRHKAVNTGEYGLPANLLEGLAPGTYTLKINVKASGLYSGGGGGRFGEANASATATFTIAQRRVDPTGAQYKLTVPEGGLICTGSPVAPTITPDAGLPGITKTIYYKDGSQTELTEVTEPGLYWVVINVGPANDNYNAKNGLKPTPDNFKIVCNPIADFTVSQEPATVLQGEQVVLTANTTASNVKWYHNDEEVTAGVSGKTLTIEKAEKDAVYYAKAYEETELCYNTQGYTLVVTPTITVTMGGEFAAKAGEWVDLGSKVVKENGGVAEFTTKINRIANYVRFNINIDGTYYKTDFTASRSDCTNKGTHTSGSDPHLDVDEIDNYTFKIWKEGGVARYSIIYPTKTPDAPAFVSPVARLCPGATQTYTVTKVAGVTYDWSITGQAENWSVVSNGDNTATVTAGTSGSAELSVKAINAGKESPAATTTISLKQVAQQPVIDGPASALPNEQNLTYSVESVTGETYAWEISGTGWKPTTASGASITINAGTATGTIKVTATAECSSETAQKTTNISAISAPEFSKTVDTACPGDQLAFAIKEVPSATSYEWEVEGNPDWSVTGAGLTATVTAGTGTASVKARALVNGVPSRWASHEVKEKPAASISTITGPTAAITWGDEVSFTATAENAVSYSWEVPANWTAVGATNAATVKFKIGENATATSVTCTVANACEKEVSKSFEGITYKTVYKYNTGENIYIKNSKPDTWDLPYIQENQRLWVRFYRNGVAIKDYKVDSQERCSGGNGADGCIFSITLTETNFYDQIQFSRANQEKNTYNNDWGGETQPIALSSAQKYFTGIAPNASSVGSFDMTVAAPTITPDGPQYAGTSVIYTATSAGADSYEWSVTGTGWAVEESTTNTASVTIGSTDGSVKVIAKNGCGAVSEATTLPVALGKIQLQGTLPTETKPESTYGLVDEVLAGESITVTLQEGTTYKFKTVDKDGNWKGNGEVFSRTDKSKELTSDGYGNDCKITPDVTGEYTFTLDHILNGVKVTVAYPAEKKVPTADNYTVDPALPVELLYNGEAQTVTVTPNSGFPEVQSTKYVKDGQELDGAKELGEYKVKVTTKATQEYKSATFEMGTLTIKCTPVAEFTISQTPDPVLTGSSVTLTANTDAAKIIWWKDHNDVGTAKTLTVDKAAAGTYYAQAYNETPAEGCHYTARHDINIAPEFALGGYVNGNDVNPAAPDPEDPNKWATWALTPNADYTVFTGDFTSTTDAQYFQIYPKTGNVFGVSSYTTANPAELTQGATEKVGAENIGVGTKYKVTWKYNGENTGTFTYEVKTKVPLKPTEILGDSPVCAGTPNHTFSIAAVEGATSYNWTVQGEGWSIVGDVTGTSVSVTAGTGQGTLSVTATNDAGTSAPETRTIDVMNAPVVNYELSPAGPQYQETEVNYGVGFDNINSADQVVWTVPATDGWSVVESAFNADRHEATAKIKIGTAAGLVKATANNSCGSASSEATIQIGTIKMLADFAQPGGALPQVAEVRAGETTQAFQLTEGETYNIKFQDKDDKWKHNGENFTRTSTTYQIKNSGNACTITPDRTGEYTFTLTHCFDGVQVTANYPAEKAEVNASFFTLNNPQNDYTGQPIAADITVNKGAAPIESYKYYLHGQSDYVTEITKVGTYSVTVSGPATADVKAYNGVTVGNITISGHEFVLEGEFPGINWKEFGRQITQGQEFSFPAISFDKTGTFSFLIKDVAGHGDVYYKNAKFERADDNTWKAFTKNGNDNATIAIDEANDNYVISAKYEGDALSAKVAYPTKTPDQPSAITGSDLLCPSTSGEYSVTAVPGLTYEWSIDNGWSVSESTTNTVTVTSAASGSATLTVYAVNGTKKSVAQTKVINVKPLPTAPIINGPSQADPMAACQFKATKVEGETYVWEVSGAGWQKGAGIDTPTETGINATAGTAQGTITVTATNTCGSTTGTMNVSVSDIPAPTFKTASADVCPNTTFTVEINAISISGATYAWSSSVAGWNVVPASNGLSAQVTVNGTSGVVKVHALVNGTPGAESTLAFNIKPQVTITGITGPASVATLETATYSVAVTEGVVSTYAWTTPTGWEVQSGADAATVVYNIPVGASGTEVSCTITDDCGRTSTLAKSGITYQTLILKGDSPLSWDGKALNPGEPYSVEFTELKEVGFKTMIGDAWFGGSAYKITREASSKCLAEDKGGNSTINIDQVGTYTIVLTKCSEGGKNGVNVAVTYPTKKHDVVGSDFTITNPSVLYTGEKQTATITSTLGITPETIVYKQGSEEKGDATGVTNAGTYDVYVSGPADENNNKYVEVKLDQQFTITGKSFSVKGSWGDPQWQGEPYQIVADGADATFKINLPEGTFEFGVTENSTGTENFYKVTGTYERQHDGGYWNVYKDGNNENVKLVSDRKGEYTFRVKYADKNVQVAIDFPAEKKELKGSDYQLENAPTWFNGTKQTVTVTPVTAGVPTEMNIKYFLNGAGSPIYDGVTNTGTYVVKIEVPANDDYKAAENLEIGQFEMKGYNFALKGGFSGEEWTESEAQPLPLNGEVTFTKTFTESGKNFEFNIIENASGTPVYYKKATFTRDTQDQWLELTTDQTMTNNAQFNVDEPNDTYTIKVKVNEAGKIVANVTYPTKTPDAPIWKTNPLDICPSATDTYAVNPVQGAASYNWTITDGWTVEGTGSSVQVTAPASGEGTLSVTVTKDGKTSKPATQLIKVVKTPAAPAAIHGPAEVEITTANITYYVDDVADATEYEWTVPDGWYITTGQGSKSVQVTSPSVPGPATISVTAKNRCSQGPAKTLAVTVKLVESEANFYYDASESPFDNYTNGLYMYIGRLTDNYTRCYDMKRVLGTQDLWYFGIAAWDNNISWYISSEQWWADKSTHDAQETIKKQVHHANKSTTIRYDAAYQNNKLYKAGPSVGKVEKYDGKEPDGFIWNNPEPVPTYTKSTVNWTIEGNGTVEFKDYDNRPVSKGATVDYLTVLKFTPQPAEGYAFVKINDGSADWDYTKGNYVVKQNTNFTITFGAKPATPQVDGKETVKNSPVLLQVKNHVEGQTYEWFDGEGKLLEGKTEPNLTVTPETTTIYTVKAVSSLGVRSDAGSVTVTVLDKMEITVNVDAGVNPTCPQEFVTLSATTGHEKFIEWWSTKMVDGKLQPARMLTTTGTDFAANFRTQIFDETTYYLVAYASDGKSQIGELYYTVHVNAVKIKMSSEHQPPFVAGQHVTLTLEPKASVKSATWNPEGTLAEGGKMNTVVIPDGVIGVYTVNVMVNDLCANNRKLSVAIPTTGGKITAAANQFHISQNGDKTLAMGFTPEPTEIICTKMISQPAKSEYASVEDIVISGTKMTWKVPKSPQPGEYKYHIVATRPNYTNYEGDITITYSNDGPSCTIQLKSDIPYGNNIFPYEPVRFAVASDNAAGVEWKVVQPVGEKPVISVITNTDQSSTLEFRAPKLGTIQDGLYVVYATCKDAAGNKSPVQEYKVYLQNVDKENCPGQ